MGEEKMWGRRGGREERWEVVGGGEVGGCGGEERWEVVEGGEVGGCGGGEMGGAVGRYNRHV